jgi:hypothetical protein
MIVCAEFQKVRRLYIIKKTGALVGMMSLNVVADGPSTTAKQLENTLPHPASAGPHSALCLRRRDR